MFEDNEFLQTVLVYAGVPEDVFEYADPIAILFVFIFSTRVFVFLLSVLLWLLVIFIRGRNSGGMQGQNMAIYSFSLLAGDSC